MKKFSGKIIVLVLALQCVLHNPCHPLAHYPEMLHICIILCFVGNLKINCVILICYQFKFMAGTYDNKRKRIIDRIKCIAFR